MASFLGLRLLMHLVVQSIPPVRANPLDHSTSDAAFVSEVEEPACFRTLSLYRGYLNTPTAHERPEEAHALVEKFQASDR